MQTIKILAKGQVVIPAALRRQLSIEVGDLLEVSVVNGHIELRPLPPDPIAAFFGSLQGGTSLAQGLQEEHRQEVERDAER